MTEKKSSALGKYLQDKHNADDTTDLAETLNPKKIQSLFFYKNNVYPPEAEYNYFSANFRLKMFL